MTRIEEVFLSGSGNARTLTTGSFGLDYYWTGKDPAKLAQDSLSQPQVNIRITRAAPVPRSFPRNSNLKMVEVSIQVDLAYRLDAELLRNQRTEIETGIVNDVSKIQNALEFPGNLLQKDDGTDTGLISGLLTMQEWTPTEINYSQHLARSSLKFRGRVILATS